jgi:hypothetical protein
MARADNSVKLKSSSSKRAGRSARLKELIENHEWQVIQAQQLIK